MDQAGDESERVEIGIGSHRFDPLDDRADLVAEAPETAEARERRPLESWIVQFTEVPRTMDAGRLRAEYGLALTEYVPRFAYVERLTAATAGRLQTDPLVRAVAPYRPRYKLDPALEPPTPAAPEETEAAEGRVRVRVILFADADIDRVRARLGDVGATDLKVLDDRGIGGAVLVMATLPHRAAAGDAAALSEVKWIEPVRPVLPTNAGAATTIHSGNPGTSAVWTQGLHGEGQVVGVLDGDFDATGAATAGTLDIGHCFFVDKADNTPRAAHRKVVAVRNASGLPAGVHPTYTAGCVAGDDVDTPGAHARRGGAWAAKLAVGALGDVADGDVSLLADLTAAAGSGAVIHSNSWIEIIGDQGDPATYTQFAVDVDTFMWNNEDHLVVGSTGNTSQQRQGPPGTAKNALCVVAARAHPDHLQLGSGSPGPTADGRRKPDLAAVGCGLQSATRGTPCGVSARGCATSWAAPHAAAAVALVRQYFTEGWYPTGKKTAEHALTPTGALLKAVMLSSTIDMTGVPGFPSDTEGWGLVQLERSLFFEGGPRRLLVFDVRHARGLVSDQEKTRTIEVENSNQPLRVVLAWTDPPGAVLAADPVRNNLDLEVTSPDGASTFKGNVFANGVSTTGGSADASNNVEVVAIASPGVGKWKVKVKAPAVTQGNPGQGYALVVAGDVTLPDCFVASALYGHVQHEDVETLRAWRDAHLAPGAPGRQTMRALAAAYDRFGPVLARHAGARPGLAAALRRAVFGPAAGWLARHDGWRDR